MSQAITHKKLLGKYYTTPELAQAITDWAIDNPSLTVFDPAFGEGALLRAASNTLRRRGSGMPARNLFGVEIDRNAKCFIEDLIQAGARRENFIFADFLATTLKDLSTVPFDVVVGNPPFVRSHQMTENIFEIARRAMEDDGFDVPKMSGYWAYFLFHSLAFLKTGGTLAMLLPSAFVSARYSVLLRKTISSLFRKASISVLNHRWFPDSEEAVVVLLAQGRLGAAEDSQEGTMESERERLLASKIGGLHLRCLRRTAQEGWTYLYEVLPQEISSFLQSSVRNELGAALREFFTVRIGVVTGANDFFVISPFKAQRLEIPDANLVPIVTTSRHLPGLWFCPDNPVLGQDQVTQALLVTSENEKDLPEKVKAYIEQGRRTSIDRRRKCRDREPWHLVRQTYVPDAFLHYMSSSLPHIVLNRSSATCTNSVLRLTWKGNLQDEDKEAVVMASITSFAQLSFEAQGRRYGGGVLKLEPSKALDVILPKIGMPVSNDAFLEVDRLLKEGDKESAIEMSDNFVLRDNLGLKQDLIRQLRDWYQRLVNLRVRATNIWHGFPF